MSNQDYTIHYISLLQENINRMSNQSANCKTWTITIVSAMIVLLVQTKQAPFYLMYCYLPILMFCFVDICYLATERAFRIIENQFIILLKASSDTKVSEKVLSSLYTFHVSEEVKRNHLRWKAIRSWSIWPFYSALMVIVLVLSIVLNRLY